MKTLQLFIALFITSFIYAQNEAPQIISPLVFSSINDQTLTIQFELQDTENDACFVQLLVSDDHGLTFNIDASNASGDVHKMIKPSIDKKIIWNYSNALISSGELLIKLVVDDGHDIDIQSIVDQVDIDRLENYLTMVSGDRHRRTGPKHLKEVRDMISRRFTTDFTNFQTQNFKYNQREMRFVK